MRAIACRLVVVAGCVVTASAGAAEIRVAHDGTGDFTTIQPAIHAAADGDEVIVAAGEYVVAEPVDFEGKAIALRSEAGAANTTIRMSETPLDPKRASVVIFAGSEPEAASLEGFTVTGGQGTRTVVEECGFDCIIRDALVGGGVFCGGTARPVLVNCRIAGNTAEMGAGVFCGSSVAFINCVIAGNDLRSDAVEPNVEGEAVYCHGPPWPRLVNCTVGALHSAIRPYEAEPFMRNCLLWGADGVGWGMEVDPAADFLDAAGGDYRLRPDSRAIDVGTSDGAPAFDLDGNVRPCGGWVDMGAYEAGDCGPQPRFRRGDANGDGKQDISDAILTLSYLFLGGAELPCDSAADADDVKGLTISDGVYLLGFLFLGGDPPPPPFPGCGWDLTVGVLDCRAYPECR